MTDPDRTEVIKGLESLRDVCNAKADMAVGEGRTAWAGYASVVYLALNLLRKQEPVKPDYSPYYQEWYCGNCGKMIPKAYKYCNYCGRAVKWE